MATTAVGSAGFCSAPDGDCCGGRGAGCAHAQRLIELAEGPVREEIPAPLATAGVVSAAVAVPVFGDDGEEIYFPPDD